MRRHNATGRHIVQAWGKKRWQLFRGRPGSDTFSLPSPRLVEAKEDMSRKKRTFYGSGTASSAEVLGDVKYASVDDIASRGSEVTPDAANVTRKGRAENLCSRDTSFKQALIACERRFVLNPQYARELRAQEMRVDRVGMISAATGPGPVSSCDRQTEMGPLPDLVVGGLKTQKMTRVYLATSTDSGHSRAGQAVMDAAARRERDASIVKLESRMLRRQWVRQRHGESVRLRQSYYRRRAEMKARRQDIFSPPLSAGEGRQFHTPKGGLQRGVASPTFDGNVGAVRIADCYVSVPSVILCQLCVHILSLGVSGISEADTHYIL